MDKDKLKKRTKQFGLDVIKAINLLPKNSLGQVVGRQLLRSSTSVGANYRAVCRARSRADFIAKLGIVEEEIDESAYWLELIIESDFLSASVVNSLLKEADELTAIVVSSKKTALGNNLPQGNQKSAIKNRQSAFTLIELVISMALLGVIMAAVMSIFSTAIRSYAVNSQKSFLQKELNFTIDNIGKDIKQAVEIPANYDDTFTTNSDTLILALPATESDGDFIYTGGVLEKDYIIYWLSGSDLKKKVYANALGTRTNSENTILSNVSSLVYTYTPDALPYTQAKISLTINRTVNNISVAISGERTSNLRNRP